MSYQIVHSVHFYTIFGYTQTLYVQDPKYPKCRFDILKYNVWTKDEIHNTR